MGGKGGGGGKNSSDILINYQFGPTLKIWLKNRLLVEALDEFCGRAGHGTGRHGTGHEGIGRLGL